MDAQLLGYYCEVQALMVQVERMKVDNLEAEIDGMPPKWRGDHFTSVQIEISEIARNLKTLNSTGHR